MVLHDSGFFPILITQCCAISYVTGSDGLRVTIVNISSLQEAKYPFLNSFLSSLMRTLSPILNLNFSFSLVDTVSDQPHFRSEMSLRLAPFLSSCEKCCCTNEPDPPRRRHICVYP